jgi:uncharacterized membrane protein YfbV (UPF0208 family)
MNKLNWQRASPQASLVEALLTSLVTALLGCKGIWWLGYLNGSAWALLKQVVRALLKGLFQALLMELV